MSKKNRVYLYTIFSLLCIHFSTQCVVKGSTTAVSVEPLASFPSADTDNTMLGFGWFQNGFSLQDSLTTCTFNSVFPVSGPVTMAGGTLTLLQDLLFHNVTTLNSWGNVIGNNCALDLCTSITAFPSQVSTFQNTNIFLNTDVVLTSSITLQGNCSINGHKNSLILGNGGALLIAPNSSVTFQNMELKGLVNSNLQCADNTGKLLLNDVVLELQNDYMFPYGSMFMQDNVTIMGTATFYYSSSQTSTIDSNSTLLLTNGAHYNLGRDSITGNEPLAFTDSTSTLKLSNCGYYVNSTGITLTKGTIFFDSYVDSHATSTSFATGVTLGTGNPADDFTVYFSPGCSVNHYGYMTYNNSQPNGMRATSDTTLLVRQPNSHVLANTNFSMPKLTVQLVSNSVAPISVTPGASLMFNETVVVLPSVEFEITGIQQNAFTYIMPGNGTINITKGSLPLYVIAQTTGNQIIGAGGLDGTITLADSSAVLTFGLNGYIGNTLALNGGSAILAHDLLLSNNGIITGPGTFNLSNYVLNINNDVTSWSTPITWQSNNGVLNLEEQISLASTWTVQGTLTIEGNSNEFDFMQNGEIVIGSNSVLTLKNLRLQSIADVNVRCIDDTGVLVLDNIYWTQTNDYTFNKGSMVITNEVDLVGSYTFFYESTQTSTILTKSTLTARDHLNFSIGKQQVVGAQEPLLLSDSTALLVVDNAQWSIGGDGMTLTKGRAICANDVLVDIASTNSTQGLKLGDGTQAGDMIFEFRPGTTVRMPRGDVVCNWFANNNVKSESTTAELIRDAANAYYCNADITLSNLKIVTEPGAPLVIAPGKTFSYNNCIFDVPGGTYTMTGEFYNAYTNLLNGNQSITMNQGTLPLYTVVTGTGNSINGNGSVTGQIIFADPSGALTWSLNGMLANNLSLNGGTLLLGANLHLGNGALINGPGIVNIGDYLVRFGSSNLSPNTPLNLVASGGYMELKSNLSLASTWTVTGNLTIQGNGNSIDLNAGNIVIDTGSTLYLSDLKLQNIGNKNIKCLDNTGILILDDVIWIQQAQDFVFDHGAILFKDDVLMTGSYVFHYETQQTSTINSFAQLLLDSNFTFSYAPASAANNLIACVDSTAELVLNGATLHATSTGLVLTNGSVHIQGKSYFSSDSSGAGISLGNTVAANDCTLTIEQGAQLNIAMGALNYKNSSVNSFNLMNAISALYFEPNTILNLYESITYPQGIIKFDQNTTLAQAAGMEINGSIDLIGQLTTTTLP